MNISIKTLTALLISTILFISCDSNADENRTTNISLNLNGLEPLGSNFQYEGWLIVDGSPVSTGVFDINSTNKIYNGTFEIGQAQAENASMFVLSIEPKPDNDPAPAATKVLVGVINDNEATLNSTIVGDFTNASGAFFLRTPTDETGTNNGNDENGLWFGTPGAPPTPNFNLPVLSEGWAYEGWVIGDNGPITTGTFTVFNSADLAAPYSQTFQPGPPIPGEDFFINAPNGEVFALDVRGRTVVISVEPVPDDSPAPFALKPLVGTAGQETAPTTHNLVLNANSLPSGTVSFN